MNTVNVNASSTFTETFLIDQVTITNVSSGSAIIFQKRKLNATSDLASTFTFSDNTISEVQNENALYFNDLTIYGRVITLLYTVTNFALNNLYKGSGLYMNKNSFTSTDSQTATFIV